MLENVQQNTPNLSMENGLVFCLHMISWNNNFSLNTNEKSPLSIHKWLVAIDNGSFFGFWIVEEIPQNQHLRYTDG